MSAVGDNAAKHTPTQPDGGSPWSVVCVGV